MKRFQKRTHDNNVAHHEYGDETVKRFSLSPARSIPHNNSVAEHAKIKNRLFHRSTRRMLSWLLRRQWNFERFHQSHHRDAFRILCLSIGLKQAATAIRRLEFTEFIDDGTNKKIEHDKDTDESTEHEVKRCSGIGILVGIEAVREAWIAMCVAEGRLVSIHASIHDGEP